MKQLKYYTGWLFLVLLTFASCQENPFVENPSGETIIYNLQITNGDLSGGARYDGVIDEDAKTITFNISAETDVAQVKFSGKLSLGAKLDKESYNFIEGKDAEAKQLTDTIRIVNVKNVQDYEVILNLADPQSTPILSKLSVRTASGDTVSAVVDLDENVVYLNTPNETEVTFNSITTIPARAEYVFSNLTDKKLNKSNPGKLSLDFLGLTAEYSISFDKSPAAGMNFLSPIIHDFTTKTTVYPDFAAEMTRSADFDGKYILLVSRQDGINPKLLKASDILADAPTTPIMLSTVGIAGGTYVISSGRLSHGHIYICNLSTGLADTDAGKLKLYHYASPTSTPELILDFNGIIDAGTNTKSTGRFGDNISLDLDEDGNGYVYFAHQTAGEILRFTITGFTTVSEPLLMHPSTTATYYACYNRVGTDNEYLYTSTVASVIQLMDKDGAVLGEINKLKHVDMGDATHGTDAHIISYNKGRYLVMTTAKQQSSWANPTLFIYDITEGFNTVAALVNFKATSPNPVYTYQLGTATQSACAGITAYAIVDGKLCILAAGPKAGMVLIEFPKNQQ
ncbi:MAG: DUF4623 domain-containing protein [Parabacteroides sp.]|nr:DUF4623 domain-containing protein [Parabacteroides sp.]